MKIVPIKEIPNNATNIPDDINQVYNTCLELTNLCKSLGGTGIAAVQVGIPWKLFVIKMGKKYRCFANCMYFPKDSLKVQSQEGCLSIVDENGDLIYYNVERSRNVIVKGKEIKLKNNKPFLESIELDLTIPDAVTFQHEIDHQRYVLISDIGTKL